MSACTFFGHRDYYSLDEQALVVAIEDLIRKGVTLFMLATRGSLTVRCMPA